MRLLVESIRLDDGIPGDLRWHDARMNAARLDLFGRSDPLSCGDAIARRVDALHVSGDMVPLGISKARVLYGAGIEAVEISPWTKRNVRSLKLVEGGDIDYSYKYADRSALESLINLRGGCDDILIVKNGRVTDTSFSNALFRKGKQLLTPLSCLLAGTRRAALIDSGLVTAVDISSNDLDGYDEAILVNAMMPLEEGIRIPVSSITW